MAIKKRKKSRKIAAKGRTRVSKGRAMVAAKRTSRPAKRRVSRKVTAARPSRPPSKGKGKP